jgi:uncharacterized protein
MGSKVYFIAAAESEGQPAVCAKLDLLIRESRVLEAVRPKDRTAVKIHFGEEGTDGYVRPAYARRICDGITARGATPFLSDANTLYKGRRLDSRDHHQLALEHGFTPDGAGAPVVIPDDSRPEELIDIPVHKKHVQTAKHCRLYAEADSLAVVTHFKGHILTSFGGALKNVGMGCASRAGKLFQHCDAPPSVTVETCIGCGECVGICPVHAVAVRSGKAAIDKKKCIGCASCIAACPTMAMQVDWGAGTHVQEKMMEYAFALLAPKAGRCAYFNFATRINKECDCWTLHNERIAPDVGIFASLDPVSIDKACFDLVNRACGKDIFKEHHPEYDGNLQLEYAEHLGLGALTYELIRL